MLHAKETAISSSLLGLWLVCASTLPFLSHHQIVEKENLLFKLSYLNSNFAVTQGYLNLALNNPSLLSQMVL